LNISIPSSAHPGLPEYTPFLHLVRCLWFDIMLFDE
jgi:hypothetical protein